MERKTFDQKISVALIDYKKLMYVQASKQALTRLEKNVCERTKGNLMASAGSNFSNSQNSLSFDYRVCL